MSDFSPSSADSSDARLHERLVEQSSDVTLVVDSTNRIRYASAAVERVLGDDPEEVVGDEIGSYVHGDEREAFTSALTAVREQSIESRTVEARFEATDGSSRWMEAVVQDQTGDEVIDGVLVTARATGERTERKKSLQTTKERLELALEGANIGIWDWDMERDRVERDELLTEMLGYTPVEMGGHIEDWERLVHPAGETRHDEALADHVENRTPYYQCEYRMRTSEGDWKWVRTIGKVVERDADGTPTRAVGIHQDIDDRKRAELALQEERDLFGEGPAVVFEWRDEDGWPIEYVTENVEDLLGYEAAQLRSGEQLFAELVHEADLPQLEREVAEQHEAGEIHLTPNPYRVRTESGDVRWVMEYTKRVKSGGETNHLLGYLVDITERKAREEKYRTLFENSRDALMLMDRDGYIDCNHQALELFGIDSVAAFTEYSPWELSPRTQPDGTDSKAAGLERIEEALEDGEAFFEWTHQRVDGTEFPAEVKLSRFEYEGEQVVQALVRDISARKAQKEQLAAERNRIRAITEAIPDVTIVYDRQGTYREVLTGQEDLLIDDSAELVGANVTEVLEPDVAGTILEGIEASLETGTVQTVEYAIDLGGKTTWFEGRIAPLPGGERDEAVLLARDSTERKEQEREIKAREEKYRNLFENTRDALMLLDREGFFDCNERTLELFGVESVDAFTELTPWDLSPEHQPDETPSRTAATEHIERAFESGEAFFEWTHERTDGTEIPCEVKLSKFELEGEPALHALVRDISDRKEKENALERAKAELRQVVDLIPDPIFAKDREGNYLFANGATAEVFGRPTDEIEGAEESTVIPDPTDSAEFRREDQAVIESGEPRQTVETLQTAAGETRIYQTSRIPFEPTETDETAVLGYARDVTELKEYEAELETQRDNLEVLNQVVRHDIRNDLQLVLAYAEILERDLEANEMDYVEQILEAASDAVEITRTARDVTDILLESDADPRPTPLAPVLESEVETARDSKQSVVVTVDGSLPAVEVVADDMLESIFRNVLKNAIIHNDKPVPEVTVSAEVREAVVEIAVADNGPGIPDERKAHIFEEGEQGIDSEGTGLGLYLAETLLDRYGGGISVADNEPEGTVFTVELPLAE